MAKLAKKEACYFQEMKTESIELRIRQCLASFGNAIYETEQQFKKLNLSSEEFKENFNSRLFYNISENITVNISAFIFEKTMIISSAPYKHWVHYGYYCAQEEIDPDAVYEGILPNALILSDTANQLLTDVLFNNSLMAFKIIKISGIEYSFVEFSA